MKTFPLFQNTDIVIGLASLYKGKKIAINVEVLDNLNRPRILHVESFALQTEGKFSGAYLLINDITQQIFAEEKLHQAITMQKNSLEDMINIIIAISGVRDPYTAGHQRRVSELAVEIGRQMKLDAHTLHGIEITAKVHDIGKVSVPSELLTRPGKISDMEHSVIKQHSEVGYNILKSIKSPWPIADIVRQHHEHLDGTGYPQGLHGDQIRLESRIITIADIVEAINSHRPYRPSLGLDVALKAINEHKGVRYDAQVIEACETVIEQGFEFSDAF
jgi:HD-GYP domain-containing protein (c-di-GMP phosphodiesterase class II)